LGGEAPEPCPAIGKRPLREIPLRTQSLGRASCEVRQA